MEVDSSMKQCDSGTMTEYPIFRMAILAEDLQRAERWCRQLHSALQVRARCCDEVPPLEIAARTPGQGLPEEKHYHWVQLLDDQGLYPERLRSLKARADCITAHQLTGSGRAIPEVQSLAWHSEDEAIDFVARMLSGVMQMSGVMHNLDWADYLEAFSSGGHCLVRTSRNEDIESAITQLLESPEELCSGGNSALLLLDDHSPPSLHQFADHISRLEMAFGQEAFIKAHLDWQPERRCSQAWLVIGHRAEPSAQDSYFPVEPTPISEIDLPDFVTKLAK
ncbi:hypothetical protein [Geopseudomonas aromaticivorans]